MATEFIYSQICWPTIVRSLFVDSKFCSAIELFNSWQLKWYRPLLYLFLIYDRAPLLGTIHPSCDLFRSRSRSRFRCLSFSIPFSLSFSHSDIHAFVYRLWGAQWRQLTLIVLWCVACTFYQPDMTHKKSDELCLWMRKIYECAFGIQK